MELDVDATYQLASKDMAGVVVDDRQASFVGKWQTSTANHPFVNAGYQHNGNTPACSATFEETLKPGWYEVRLTYPPNKNRASNLM